MICHLNTYFIKFCRILSIFLTFCGAIITAFYVYDQNYSYSECGCIKRFKENRHLPYDYSIIAVLILSQTILFFLFVYPLKFLKDCNAENLNSTTIKTRNVLKKSLIKV